MLFQVSLVFSKKEASSGKVDASLPGPFPVIAAKRRPLGRVPLQRSPKINPAAGQVTADIKPVLHYNN